MAFKQIPYPTEQGICKRVSGNFFRGTGNLIGGSSQTSRTLNTRGQKRKRLRTLNAGSYAESRVSGEPELYPPVAFRRAPAARKSASDDRFTAGARLRRYLSRRSALPARAHIASDVVTVPARWPPRWMRAAPSFRPRW